MSLATRCTSCDTVFRVVQDQLKVSDGWVRCGRCNEVFNALEGLFDLEPAPAAATAMEVPIAAPAMLDTAPDGASPAPSAAVPAAERAIEPAIDESPFATLPMELDATPASVDGAPGEAEIAVAPSVHEPLAEEGHDLLDAATEAAEALPILADEPPPEFLRQAERQAQWERPRTVVALGLLGVVLLLALVAQAALHQRDLLAAAAPPLRPALQALCNAAGCRVEPLRRIDDIVIESSTLAAAPSGEAARLSVVLRNRGTLPLAMPAVELTLTDASGQLLTRRVLSPTDFAVSIPTLPAASEAALQLVLATPGHRPAGYTIEPFYP